MPFPAFHAKMSGKFGRSLLSWGPRHFSRDAAGPHLSRTGLPYIRGLDGCHVEVGGAIFTSAPGSRPAGPQHAAGMQGFLGLLQTHRLLALPKDAAIPDVLCAHGPRAPGPASGSPVAGRLVSAEAQVPGEGMRLGPRRAINIEKVDLHSQFRVTYLFNSPAMFVV